MAFHRLRRFENAGATLQPHRVVAVGIAHFGGEEAFKFLRIMVDRVAGKLLRHAGIEISPEARIVFHQLQHRGFGNGVDQRFFLHHKLMMAAAFHQRPRFKRIVFAIQRQYIAVVARFFDQAFDDHIQMLNRLLFFDDDFIVFEKSDVDRFLQHLALAGIEKIIRRIIEIETFHALFSKFL